MAIEFVAASITGDISGTTRTISKPTGTAEDDMVLVHLYNIGAKTVATPAGWTKLYETVSATDIRATILARVVGASEPASWDFTQSAAAWGGGTAHTYRGVSAVNVTGTGRYTTSDTTIRASSVTTTAADCLVVWLGVWQKVDWGTNNPLTSAPSGHTQRTSSAFENIHTYVGDKAQASAGASGTVDGTLTSAVTDKDAVLVALEPVPSIPVAALHTLTMMGAGKA